VPLHHVLNYSGALFIAFYTPFYVPKKRYQKRARKLLGVHVLANLAFTFISTSVLGTPFLVK